MQLADLLASGTPYPEQQLVEIEALEAIYQDDLTISTSADEAAADGPHVLSCTIALDPLLFAAGEAVELEQSQPMVVVVFPPLYPVGEPPRVSTMGLHDGGTATAAVTASGDVTATGDALGVIGEKTNKAKRENVIGGLIAICLEENEGEETVMQLVMVLNDFIQQRNVCITSAHAAAKSKRAQVLHDQQAAKHDAEARAQQEKHDAESASKARQSQILTSRPFLSKWRKTWI